MWVEDRICDIQLERWDRTCFDAVTRGHAPTAWPAIRPKPRAITGMSFGPNATAMTPRVTTTSPMLNPSGMAEVGVRGQVKTETRRPWCPEPVRLPRRRATETVMTPVKIHENEPTVYSPVNEQIWSTLGHNDRRWGASRFSRSRVSVVRNTTKVRPHGARDDFEVAETALQGERRVRHAEFERQTVPPLPRLRSHPESGGVHWVEELIFRGQRA